MYLKEMRRIYRLKTRNDIHTGKKSWGQLTWLFGAV